MANITEIPPYLNIEFTNISKADQAAMKARSSFMLVSCDSISRLVTLAKVPSTGNARARERACSIASSGKRD